MRRPGLLLVCLSLAAAAGCASFVPPRHAEFRKRHPTIRTVAVLPPDVEVYKLTFKGDRDMMWELLPPIRQRAQEELERTLAKRGYQVQPLNAGDDVLQQDPALRTSLYMVRELFAKQAQEYHKHFFRRFTYSIGPEINVFADRADADALVIVRCFGLKKTGGEIAGNWAQTILVAAATLGAVVPVQSPSITIVQMALLDGVTGDILWYTHNSVDSGFDIAREQRFRRKIRGMIKGLPKAKARAGKRSVAAPPSAP